MGGYRFCKQHCEWRPFANAIKQVLDIQYVNNPNQALGPGLPVISRAWASPVTPTPTAVVSSWAPSSTALWTSLLPLPSTFVTSVLSRTTKVQSAEHSSFATTVAPSRTSAIPSTATSSSGSCEAPFQPCSNVGNIICFGIDSFGICDVNNCALPQTVAAGTLCKSGTIARRDSQLTPPLPAVRRMTSRRWTDDEETAHNLEARAPADVANLAELWKLESLEANTLDWRAINPGKIPFHAETDTSEITDSIPLSWSDAHTAANDLRRRRVTRPRVKREKRALTFD